MKWANKRGEAVYNLTGNHGLFLKPPRLMVKQSNDSWELVDTKVEARLPASQDQPRTRTLHRHRLYVAAVSGRPGLEK